MKARDRSADRPRDPYPAYDPAKWPNVDAWRAARLAWLAEYPYEVSGVSSVDIIAEAREVRRREAGMPT